MDTRYSRFLSESEEIEETNIKLDDKKFEASVTEAEDEIFWFSMDESDELDEKVEVPSDYATRELTSKDTREIKKIARDAVKDLQDILSKTIDLDFIKNLKNAGDSRLKEIVKFHAKLYGDLLDLKIISGSLEDFYNDFIRNEPEAYEEFAKKNYVTVCKGIEDVYEELEHLKKLCSL